MGVRDQATIEWGDGCVKPHRDREVDRVRGTKVEFKSTDDRGRGLNVRGYGILLISETSPPVIKAGENSACCDLANPVHPSHACDNGCEFRRGEVADYQRLTGLREKCRRPAGKGVDLDKQAAQKAGVEINAQNRYSSRIRLRIAWTSMLSSGSFTRLASSHA